MTLLVPERESREREGEGGREREILELRSVSAKDSLRLSVVLLHLALHLALEVLPIERAVLPPAGAAAGRTLVLGAICGRGKRGYLSESVRKKALVLELR